MTTVSHSRTMGVMWRIGIAIAAAAVAGLSGSAHADPPTLTAIVGTNDEFVITLNDASGTRVTRLLPGTYTVVVDDRSTIHNFHLASNSDPDVNFRTELAFVGKQSFTVTFKNDTEYAYACEPHWQQMNGSFFVTDEPATPPPPPPPPPARVKVLHGSVSASGAVRLIPSSVESGRFRVVVGDRSRKANFHLAGRGVNRRTGVAFRGSVTWRVRLVRGTYRYGSDRRATKKRLRVR